uniref:Zinc finger, C3HC4 type (RING finger) protein n=1 Tax=Toxoplasma gondii COUG TaxID=1074873 RepID=A0A2G8YC22_TOXGO|nr:zinc finger, C3HC4 type (RING finger) protein [Toxoplasma gondii COUG]
MVFQAQAGIVGLSVIPGSASFLFASVVFFPLSTSTRVSWNSSHPWEVRVGALSPRIAEFGHRVVFYSHRSLTVVTEKGSLRCPLSGVCGCGAETAGFPCRSAVPLCERHLFDGALSPRILTFSSKRPMVSAGFSSSLRFVQWRFKGSNTPYAPVSLPLPVFCGEIRAFLKKQTGLEATPQLDALLFLESDPSNPLSDLFPLRHPCSLLLQRTSAAEAQAALDIADRAFHRQKDSTPAVTDIVRSASVGDFHDVSAEKESGSKQLAPSLNGSRATPNVVTPARTDQVDPSSSSGGLSLSTREVPFASGGSALEGETGESANNDEEDEAALLQAVIEQHAEHRGPQTSSSQAVAGGGFASSEGRFSAGYSSGFGRGRGWGFSAGRGYQAPSLGASAAGAAQTAFGVGRGAVGSNLPTAAGYVPVGEDYICHMCGERGHHIRNCTRSNDPRHQKKIRPATGIPSSFLRDISVDDIPRYAEVYIRKDGSFAVMKNAKQMSSLSYFSSDLDTKIERHVGSSDVAAHLKCPLCGLLFSQPVATPCCGESFCRGCLLRVLHPSRGGTGGFFPGGSGFAGDSEKNSAKKSGGCPSCGRSIDLRDVLCNTALQKSVDAIVRSTSSFKEPDATESARPPFPPLSTVPSVSGRVAPSASSSQRTANGGGVARDVSSSAVSSCAAPHASNSPVASSGASGGEPCAMAEEREEKREKKEGSNDVVAAGTVGVWCASGEASSVKTEHVEREVSCPRDAVALKDVVGTQTPSEPDPSKRAPGAALVEPAAASAPSNDSLDRNSAPGDHGNDTQGGNTVGSSATKGRLPEEAQSGLPPGVDLQELEEQHIFAAAYIAQYLQRRREKRKRRRILKICDGRPEGMEKANQR